MKKKSKYARRHVVSPFLKNYIRLAHAKRFLNLRLPDLGDASSMLIIGAGASCDDHDLSRLAANFEKVVTLNSALFVFSEADLNSFEFATQDQAMCKEMIDWINVGNISRLWVKPHSIWPMSVENRRILFRKQRSILEHQNSGRTSKRNRLCPVMTGIYQHHFPAYLDIRSYAKLVSKERKLFQWNGSLSLWLDVAHLYPKITRVGLVGTDFGGPYARNAMWYSSSAAAAKEHLLATDRSCVGGPKDFLTLLEYLGSIGYLDGVKFEHFHRSKPLETALSQRLC